MWKLFFGEMMLNFFLLSMEKYQLKANELKPNNRIIEQQAMIHWVKIFLQIHKLLPHNLQACISCLMKSIKDTQESAGELV